MCISEIRKIDCLIKNLDYKNLISHYLNKD